MITRLFSSKLFWLLLAITLGTAGGRAATFTVSPITVSNTYSGFITLTATGLNAGETVFVQKFADGNTNGVIDAADLLVQQFTLTDGAATVIGGVTNLNVPGDTDNTSTQITAKLNFQAGDFVQNIVGNYLYRLSRTTGPVATNLFTVTNASFGQSVTISGLVTNSGTNVPYATVILFQPSGEGLNPGYGCQANTNGAYSIKAPPGTYMPVAFKTNFVANTTTAPTVTLTNGATLTTNLALILATQNFSGKVVDAANASLGIPGLFSSIQSTNGLIGIGSTDTNGNFTMRVNTNSWKLGTDSGAIALHGYVKPQSSIKTNTFAGSVVGVTVSLPKATALFYGSVKTDTGAPLAGVRLYDSDQNTYLYEDDPTTDANGNYFGGALAGTWALQIDNQNPGYTNYVFTPDIGQTSLSNGTVVLQNFIAKLATNHITGYVHDSGGHSITNLNVYAYANINGTNYLALGVNTDANGNFWLNVASGNWSVGVNCNGGDNSLDGILGNGTYQCPNNLNASIANSNGTANFTIQPCGGVQINTPNLPDGQVGAFYDQFLDASSCAGNFNWQVLSGAPGWLTLDLSSGELYGTPDAPGTNNLTVQVTDGNNNVTNRSWLLIVTGAVAVLQVDTVSIPGGTNGIFYATTLSASGGQPPYSWSYALGSATLPGPLTLNTNGNISGSPAGTGTYYFTVHVTDDVASGADSSLLSLNIVNPPLQPLVITNTSLPSGTGGATYSAQLGATGGQTPYNCWALALGSANPPPGLSLNCDGSITGTPTNLGTFYFRPQAMDYYGSTTNKLLSITVNVAPVLSLPSWLNNQFRARLTGATGQNYTVQYSTTLTNWNPLLITNSSTTNSFLVTDPAATNKQRTYRVLVGP